MRMSCRWRWRRWLAKDDEELQASQYRVLELWQKSYGGELLMMLPDTFGTTQFLEGAPDWVADWTGQRADSKDPFEAGDEYIRVAAGARAGSAEEAAYRVATGWMWTRSCGCTATSRGAYGFRRAGERC